MREPQPVPAATVQPHVDLPANTPRADARGPAELRDPSCMPGPRQDLIHGPPALRDRGPRTALAWVAIALTLHLILDGVLGGTSRGAFRGSWTPDPSAGMVQGWLWTVLDHPFRSAVGLTALIWALWPGFRSLPSKAVPLESSEVR